MSGVLHVVSAALRRGVEPPAVDRAARLARELSGADGVEAGLVGRSEDRLVVSTWLTGREALEPFAASPAHMEFVMRGLAPVAARMWSAAVEVERPAPAAPAALWAFALHHRDGVYEWQVRGLIDEIDALPGEASAGPTVEEREQFRAAGVVCLSQDQTGPFERRLTDLRAQWRDGPGELDDALVTVLP